MAGIMNNNNNNHNKKYKIGIVSGKLGDVDGVSLEVNKWIDILLKLGHDIYTVAGKYKTELKAIPPEKQILLEKISFSDSEQQYYEKLLFPYLQKVPAYLSKEQKQGIVDKLEIGGNEVANILFEFIQDYSIDVIIAENTNAMPMTLFGGIGIYKLATERRIATIFHHHDFWWERSRFSHNPIEGLLSTIMPPADPGLEHIVISSYAAHILRSIKRVEPFVIPNCEDFDNPPMIDDYNRDLRADLGFKTSDILIVQPTRIVRRKRIEDSVNLIGKLIKKYPDIKERVNFIISLYQGDEPDENYIGQIKRLADEKEVKLHLISDRVACERYIEKNGSKIYTNRDILTIADIVTYLPIWEGFGNALLEAIAAKVPVVTTTYLVYKTDIKIMGFKNIEIRDVYDEDEKLVIPERAVDEVYHLLTNPKERDLVVKRNFRIAAKEFGFKKLTKNLKFMLEDYGDEIKASRKRIQKSKKNYSV